MEEDFLDYPASHLLPCVNQSDPRCAHWIPVLENGKPAFFSDPNFTLPSFNLSDFLDAGDGESPHSFIYGINKFGIPIIVFPGILGNTLALTVFLWTHLKLQSSSIYLAFLNMADTGFLISLLPNWSSWFGSSLVRQNGWCQITIFSSLTFALLSIWAVVCISIERYIVVFYPWLRHKLCSRRCTVYVVCILIVLACLSNCYLFWMLESFEFHGIWICLPRQNYRDLLRVMVATDTLLRFVLPIIMIVCVNGRIGLHIAKTMDVGKKSNSSFSGSGDHLIPPGEGGTNKGLSSFSLAIDQLTEDRTSSENGADEYQPMKSISGVSRSCGAADAAVVSHEFYCESCNYVPPSQTAEAFYSADQRAHSTASANKRNPRIGVVAAHYRESRERRRRYQLQATRSLVTISSVFVILNFPLFAYRVYSDILSVTSSEADDTDADRSDAFRITGEICLFLHYLNFSVNFIMYVLISRHFRRGLRRLFLRLRKNACRHFGKRSIPNMTDYPKIKITVTKDKIKNRVASPKCI